MQIVGISGKSFAFLQVRDPPLGDKSRSGEILESEQSSGPSTGLGTLKKHSLLSGNQRASPLMWGQKWRTIGGFEKKHSLLFGNQRQAPLVGGKQWNDWGFSKSTLFLLKIRDTPPHCGGKQ